VTFLEGVIEVIFLVYERKNKMVGCGERERERDRILERNNKNNKK
jgi:hypothetical protein